TVRAAGLNPDLADDRERSVAHHLIFLVCQRLHWRDRDGVARMHAHWIEILNRTDNDAVVHSVAHHFHFKFFPADERFLDQGFVYWRHRESAPGDFIQIVRVVSGAATAAAERARLTTVQRKCSDLLHNPDALSH